MKQFNFRLDDDTAQKIVQLTVAMAESRGLPGPLSQADVIKMAVKSLADKELTATKKNNKKSPQKA